MDFTREPIIETVITPREGFKIVVRSSKNIGQEEYFVDALEVVSFGNAFFFRNLEKPKAFLVPASDYEILEVREARIVLKNVGTEKSIKIGGGREAPAKAAKEAAEPKAEAAVEVSSAQEGAAVPETAEAGKQDGRVERKRDRRRQFRKRRGRDEEAREPAPTTMEQPLTEEEKALIGEDREGRIILPPPVPGMVESGEAFKTTSSILSSLLTPPPQLISETIKRYKEDSLFKDAFYEKEGEVLEETEPLSFEFTPESEAPASSFAEEPEYPQEEPKEEPQNQGS